MSFSAHKLGSYCIRLCYEQQACMLNKSFAWVALSEKCLNWSLNIDQSRLVVIKYMIFVQWNLPCSCFRS